MTIPILRHYIAAARHACGYNRHAGQPCFQQNTGNSLAILGRESKHISKPKKCRNVGSRTECDHVRCMPVDQSLVHGKGTFALSWADKQETDAGPRLLNNPGGFEKGGYALLYGQSAHRKHDFGVADPELST